MTTLYTWTTPNGRKISIALEELGLPYKARAIDITKGDQNDADFRALNPNGKIPVLVEEDGRIVNESNAILLYLAEKSGQFVPKHGTQAYWDMLEWLMWQASGFGPMLGQAHHFLRYNRGKSEYSEQRFHAEAERLYGILDQKLTGRAYMLKEMSILEFAIWPWVSRFEHHEVDLSAYPAVCDWYLRLAERPGFIKGYIQPFEVEPIPLPKDA